MITPCPLPPAALLQSYARSGDYTDCFATDIPLAITYAQFVEAFYTTWLFKLERVILKWALSRPSTDAEARALAQGSRHGFAAWDVEERAPDQLLLRDMYGTTRSWLMTEPVTAGTRLYFGSAVVRQAMKRPHFSALMDFHKAYSRALLGAAARAASRA
ncbi:MAG TPA: hypothetical protein VM240_07500 [Verrucomicrobiae bacterium]|nr:hypothetical protein [Verrucomicrobiae bacterium]